MVLFYCRILWKEVSTMKKVIAFLLCLCLVLSGCGGIILL
nr:MAG TPA: outer membrane protein assembly factor [Bacteriophage sp.]